MVDICVKAFQMNWVSGMEARCCPCYLCICALGGICIAGLFIRNWVPTWVPMWSVRFEMARGWHTWRQSIVCGCA